MVFGCFNSRTREGCDACAFLMVLPMLVSIHAPARGAMRLNNFFMIICLFQFTHPRGVRFTKFREFAPQAVSIHAPARGAIISTPRQGSMQSFNSRTREGCDVPSIPTITTEWFQFTHPRGVRSSAKCRPPSSIGFNSRTREGCDDTAMFRRASW